MTETETPSKRRRAVFLDRDGVINELLYDGPSPRAPWRVDECRLLPGASEASALCRDAGFLVIVVTNQPDVPRGHTTRTVVEAINDRIRRDVFWDDIRVCYHDNADRCACRKPEPGLIVEAAAEFGIDIESSFLIGDRWKDVVAGQRARCRTILVEQPHNEGGDCTPDFRAPSILDGARWIVEGGEHHGRNDSQRD